MRPHPNTNCLPDPPPGKIWKTNGFGEIILVDEPDFVCGKCGVFGCMTLESLLNHRENCDGTKK